MKDFLIQLFFALGGFGLIVAIVKKFIPKEKTGDIVQKAGSILSMKSGKKFGKSVWQWFEDFVIEWIDYHWYRFKKGMREDNPDLLKKIEIMEKLRIKVAGEGKSTFDVDNVKVNNNKGNLLK